MTRLLQREVGNVTLLIAALVGIIDPRPNVALAAKSANIYVTPTD
jgi:hypothetical protein